MEAILQSMRDELLATNIRKTSAQLNALLEDAAENGLRVDIDLLTQSTLIGDLTIVSVDYIGRSL